MKSELLAAGVLAGVTVPRSPPATAASGKDGGKTGLVISLSKSF